MTIKKVSVTKTSSYSIDGEGIVTRERIVEMSHNWTERDVTLFKKLAKQGGRVNFKELSIQLFLVKGLLPPKVM